jgi:hypothetical protein
MEIPGKVESNIKKRVDSTRTIASKEVGVVRSTIRDLVGLKPVQAIVGLVTDTVDNIGDWLKDQAKITREWIL